MKFICLKNQHVYFNLANFVRITYEEFTIIIKLYNTAVYTNFFYVKNR